jgi:hypothetical protein
MVLHVTNEGDFQDCYIVVERTRQTLTRSVTHTRRMDIRSFPSVADCAIELDSEAYWAGADCFYK